MQGQKVVNATASDKKGFLFSVCQGDDGVNVVTDFKAFESASDGFSGYYTLAILRGVVGSQDVCGADGCCTNSGKK